MPRPKTHECGGQIQTLYKRTSGQWVPVGMMCLGCWVWVKELTVDSKPQIVTVSRPPVDSNAAVPPPTVYSEPENVTVAPPSVDSKPPIPAPTVDSKVERAVDKMRASVCTCTPAERVKGKHNKWCPAK